MNKVEKVGLTVFAVLCVVLGFGVLVTDVRPVGAQSTPLARTLAEQLQGMSAVTCPANADGGAGCTLTAEKGVVAYTCADVDGCAVTLSEVGAANLTGRALRIVNVSANACTFADTSGVSELAGGFAAGQWDALTVIYSGDRWVELGRSNN